MDDLDSPLRFIGGGEEYMLAHDTSDGRWKVAEQGYWDDIEEHETFDSCEQLLGWLDRKQFGGL